MSNAVTTSLPKNKTGIFASEIQKMIVPKSKEKKTLALSEPSKLNARLKMASLSHCLTDSSDYRTKHSAFRVNVRSRKPLESVNVKLKEAQQQQQQRPISSRTRTVSSLTEDDEAEYTARGSPVRKHDEAYTDEYVQMKNSFKPSAVRRTKQAATPSSEGGRYGSSFTRLSAYNDEARGMTGSSFNKQRGSTASFYERKQYCSDRQYLRESRYRDSKLDSSVQHNRVGSSKFTHHNNIDLVDTDGEHLKDSSETTVFTTLNIPARSELNSVPGLLNEIFAKQEIHSTEFLKSLKSQSTSIKSGMFQANSDVLTSSLQYPNQYKQMQYYKNNLDVQSQQNLEKYRAMMDNLDEEEFLKFLKIYRETKLVPPPKQSLISFKSTLDPNFYKAPTSIEESDKNSITGAENEICEQSQPQPKFMSLQTQSLSLENSYLPIQQTPSKLSNFYVNYISNKLNEKNEPNNLTVIMNNILGERSGEKGKKHFYKNKNFVNNHTSPSEAIHFKSDQRFRPVNTKLVNLSAFA